MKGFGRIAILAIAAVVLTTAGVALAAEFKSPVEILSGLSGQSIEELRNQRLEGMSYGAIAEDYDKLDQFREQMLGRKKAILEQRVEDGVLTREEADEIEDSLAANCNGEGRALCGQRFGAGFGMGFNGNQDGQGRKMNMLQNGQGRGPGRGWGR